MKAAASALRENAIRAAVKMLKAGCGLHQQFQCLQITGCHAFHALKLLSFAASPANTPAFGQQKKRVCFLLQIGEETNPLRLRCSSDDFSDGMNDTEQQPDEEGESSDETAYD